MQHGHISRIGLKMLVLLRYFVSQCIQRYHCTAYRKELAGLEEEHHHCNYDVGEVELSSTAEIDLPDIA